MVIMMHIFCLLISEEKERVICCIVHYSPTDWGILILELLFLLFHHKINMLQVQ